MHCIKYLLIGFFIFGTVGQAYSAEKGKISIGPYFSYDTVSMDKWNDDLIAAGAAAATYGMDAEITKIEKGVSFGVEGLYQLKDNLQLGARIGFLSTNTGKANFSYEAVVLGVPLKTILDMEAENSLTSVLGGVKYSFPTGAEKLKISGLAFAGIGSAETKLKTEVVTTEIDPITGVVTYPSEKDEDTETGSGLVLDFGVETEYTLSPSISLVAGLGYRLANIDIEIEGEKVETDFSGLMVKAGLNFKF